MLEERAAVLFCYVIDQLVKDLSKSKKSGKSYKGFIKAGLTSEDMDLLREMKLISFDEEKPNKAVWIIWKNIKDQRIQWAKNGYNIPIDCNKLKALGIKKYKEMYLQDFLH